MKDTLQNHQRLHHKLSSVDLDVLCSCHLALRLDHKLSEAEALCLTVAETLGPSTVHGCDSASFLGLLFVSPSLGLLCFSHCAFAFAQTLPLSEPPPSGTGVPLLTS